MIIELFAPLNNIYFMLDLFDLIHNIEKRPAMYLGQLDITHLSAFLSGYFFARRQSGIPETLQEQQFAEFQAWVEQKFNVTYSQPWEKIIRFFSPDETASLQQFFILFNEFTESQTAKEIAS
ncbi:MULTISPECIES: hypothetical protein [Leptolyngbya]|uniref:hypothetical protein n=1 Tax=Leptolyngbya TaxID=47251 RepID=UPI0018EF53EF|nr:hypothetical protein [Leptolyngbya sp. FACHB-1624]